MRKIFLDLGAWNGASVKYYRKHFDNSCEVFCFEPLPGNIEILEKLKSIWGFRLIKAAASTVDGTAKFYIGMSESGSLSDKKRTGGLNGNDYIEVKTIDFPLWFDKLITGDYVPEITIKMNIEGAEYDIINRMHEYGMLPFVHKWFVQWHWDKIGLNKLEHDRISGLIKWQPWNVM